MALRRCARCGAPLPRNATARRKYCGTKCRVAANRGRKDGEPAETDETADAGSDTKPGQKPEPDHELDRNEFERMMDDDMETVLRKNRDALQRAMDDPGTPATALPAISRQLISVCRELEQVAGGDQLLAATSEPEEVPEDDISSYI